jgi:hypothetical protein
VLHLILNGAAVRPSAVLILGGAAVYRCDSCLVLNAALAAEGASQHFYRSLLERCQAALDQKKIQGQQDQQKAVHAEHDRRGEHGNQPSGQ